MFKNKTSPLKLFLFLFTVIFYSCATNTDNPTSTSITQDPDLYSELLENGLQFFTLENDEEENRITFFLTVNAGSVLEEEDQLGVAHLVEHMCFNGTKHFEKQQIVQYFESIGMSFGPEVNAYTSYDQTVYSLQIPADDPEIMENTLLILKDWATAVSFDPEELEKEKGVVLEEWRSGRGASGRIMDIELPLLFEGSRYAERLTIGDPEIIRNISVDRVRDFYETWYRPDLMSIVAVGDFSQTEMNQIIRDTFSVIPSSEKPKDRIDYPGPEVLTPQVLLLTDPEITMTSLEILEISPYFPILTREDFKRSLIDNMGIMIMNNRLQRELESSTPTYMAASLGSQVLVRNTEYTYLSIRPSTDMLIPALKNVIDSIITIKQYGITDAELERFKTVYISQIDQLLANDDQTSTALANLIVSNTFSETPLISLEDKHLLIHSIIPEITLDNVNDSISRWFASPNQKLFVSAPEAERPFLPSENQLMEIWTNYSGSKDSASVVVQTEQRPLYPENQVEGSVLSEEMVSQDNIIHWDLSNGAEVLFLQTDYANDEILFQAISPGGLSLAEDENYYSALLSPSLLGESGLNGFSILDLQELLAGKMMTIQPWIADAYEGLSGESNNRDLETFFQLIHLYFTHPEFSETVYESLMTRLQTYVNMRQNNPDEVFSDLKDALVTQSNLRTRPLNRETLGEMNLAEAETFFKDRFADASDFAFIFVGNIDPVKLKNYCETYLAGLPNLARIEEGVDRDINFPSQVVSETLQMGIEPKSRVFLSFNQDIVPERWESEMFEVVKSLLDIRLREIIREDMSGTYGVSLYGQIETVPRETVSLSIEFGCEPGREEELTQAVFSQLQWIMNEEIPEEYLTRLKENITRSMETAVSTNAFWLTNIMNNYLMGFPYDEITLMEPVIEMINSEEINRCAARYINTENYVQAILMPGLTE